LQPAFYNFVILMQVSKYRGHDTYYTGACRD